MVYSGWGRWETVNQPFSSHSVNVYRVINSVTATVSDDRGGFCYRKM